MKLRSLYSACFLLSLICSTSLYAQGNLMIMPKRLVFDGTQRSQEIHLINIGTDTATYAINFVQYKMTNIGGFEEITEPEEGQNFASEFLRYYPRKITLGPNESQNLKVQLTKTGNLVKGEYRSHMNFKAIEEQVALGEIPNDSTENLSIKIKTVFGISIPIIIRKGEDNSKIIFSDLVLNIEKEVPEITMILNRVGTMSVYGNLDITYISPTGINLQVAKIKGIAVYTPNKQRIFTMQLKNLEIKELDRGQLKIVYKEENGRSLGEALLDLK